MTKPPLVYVLQAQPSTPVKIGWTGRPLQERLTEIQVGNPYRLRVLHTLPGARPLEWQLHQHVQSSRLEGEWFAWTDEVRELLALIAKVSRELALATGDVPDARDLLGFNYLPAHGSPDPVAVDYAKGRDHAEAVRAENRLHDERAKAEAEQNRRDFLRREALRSTLPTPLAG